MAALLLVKAGRIMVDYHSLLGFGLCLGNSLSAGLFPTICGAPCGVGCRSLRAADACFTGGLTYFAPAAAGAVWTPAGGLGTDRVWKCCPVPDPSNGIERFGGVLYYFRSATGPENLSGPSGRYVNRFPSNFIDL